MNDNFDEIFNDDAPVNADFRPASVQLWRTADGKVMRMSDMAESHVENAKNYTLRRIEDIEARIKRKAEELVAEPFMLSFYSDDLGRLRDELDGAVGALRALKEEAGRRVSRKDEAAALRKEIEESK